VSYVQSLPKTSASSVNLSEKTILSRLLTRRKVPNFVADGVALMSITHAERYVVNAREVRQSEVFSTARFILGDNV
jgi:hypothetical protein